MSGVLFSWVKTDPLDEKFTKSSISTNNSLVGNNERHIEKQFKNISLLGGLIGIETLKIIFLVYVGTGKDGNNGKLENDIPGANS